MALKYIVFDVAGTLLYKPELIKNIQSILKESGYEVSMQELLLKHKLVSEIVIFPDQTSQSFYNQFNHEFLLALGVNPNQELIDKIFKSCTYLSWAPFEDTHYLNQLYLPKAVLSNWDISLRNKLDHYFPNQFGMILGSAKSGLRKPDPKFYQLLLMQLNCNADDVLYIGDSLRLDIAPALNLGINALLIDRENIYPNAGVQRISNMKEIANWIK
jgi:HAD superfamily hydrolase (TIGR01493 family)